MERLRWVLIAGSALLVVVVAAFVGYGRYRAFKTFQTLLKRSGATITHETNGFTYSQSLKGKTVFTLHAAKAVQHSDGTWSLRDADLTLYSRTSARTDHIYGSEFSWDPKAEIARAVGEVHMDLQAPESMTHAAEPTRIGGKEGRPPSAPRPPSENRQTIHVRTSGLVYLRSLGVAATQEDVEFHYEDMEAHSRGAEFEEGESSVHLLADVRLNATLHGKPVTLHAAKADLDRENNLTSLLQPVVNTDGRTLSAANALLHMRKDGSIESADASGGVTMIAGTQQIHGAQLNLRFGNRMELQHGLLSGGVTLVDMNPEHTTRGSSQTAEAAFDASGNPILITADGSATLTMLKPGVGGVKLNRSMSGDKILVALTQSGRKTQVTSVDAVGRAHADSESLVLVHNGKGVAGRRTTAIAADDLLATFAEGDRRLPSIQHLTGTGHARLQQNDPGGAQELSTADTLDASFSPATNGTGELQLTTAIENGHVSIRTVAAARNGKPGAVSTASSQRALYDGAAETLTLTGAAQLHQNGVEVSAKTVTLNQSTGNAEANGDVLASLTNTDPKSKRDSSHVMAMRATFAHDVQLAQFFATDAHPAKLWQEGSQILAAQLTMDGVSKTLLARPQSPGGKVIAIFTSTSAATPSARATPRAIRIVSPRMDYADSTSEAVFAGGVTMHASAGDVRAQRGVVFLHKTPATKTQTAIAATPATGQIDHAVLTGDVHLVEPGRSGTGEELLYTAATDSFVLTGTPSRPPHIVDAQQGNVTGTTLLFGAADSTIIVAGTPGANHASGGRVRTETTVGP